MFNLRQLRSFIYVAQHKSFTKAAKLLYMTQPAVSAQIKSLEERLDVQLMERNDKKVVLTQAGEIFLGEAERVLQAYERILESLDELKGLKRGYIKIAASTIPGEYILPKFIGFFKQKFPQVNIELMITDTEQVVQCLKERSVDLGITGAKVKSDIIKYEPLLEDELIIVAPCDSKLATKKNPSIEDLKGEQFILRELGSGTRKVMLERLKVHHIDETSLNVVMELGSTRAVISAVESGIGISIISRWAASQSLALETLKEIKIEGWNSVRPLFLACNVNKFCNKATETFIEELKEFDFKV